MTAVKADAGSFTRALDAALRAVSTDPAAEAVFRCLLFEVGEGRLRVVGTDKRRLAVSEIEAEAEVEGEDATGTTTALVEGAAFRALDLPRKGSVDLRLDDAAVRISIGGHVHTLDVVAGTYPDYHVFLAGDPAARPIVVDRAALLSAIEDQPDDEPLLVRVKPGAVELGQLVPVRVEADYDGEALALHIDAVVLHDAVESTAGPRVVVEAVHPLRPIVIRSAEPDAFTGVVMPLQVGRRGR
jgi:DNA polymerase III sliding clamp (beta) subunit (PCNA family)